MNARIASILKDRISQFTYVDRIAGMVRTAQMERAGQVVKLPVAIDVDDDLACDASTLRDMVPDEAYACMVYFEDRGFQRITSRTRGTSFRSGIRLVCWVNTAKFGGDPMAGERIMQQFLAEVHQPGPVNTDTLVGLRTTAETSPERGGGLFGAYTYPESSRQYLLWPFDAFAIDIAAEYRLRPGCEEEPVPGDDTCWTPPTTKRRRNPSEFTCEELQDPETGLTAEQLGPECLDCEGGGGSSDPVTITSTSGAEQLPPVNCGETYPLPFTHIFYRDNLNQPGLALVDLPTRIEEGDGHLYPDIEIPSRDILNSAGVPATSFRVTLDDLVNNTVPVAQDASWTLKDTAGNTLDTGSIPSFGSADIEAPDGVVELTDDEDNVFQTANVRSGQTLQIEVADSQVEIRNSVPTTLDVVQVAPEGTQVYTVGDSNVQLRDSAANAIGSPVAVPAATSPSITAPDGSVTIRNSIPTTLHTVAVRSNGSTTQAIADSTITRPDGTTEGLPATVALDVRSYRSGIVYNFGYILVSGQTASYRTGDEGSYRTAGFFNYTRPVYPLAYAELSAGTWDTLAANNIHGNTLRFTNRSGGAAATSGNRVIQDHLTGLEWYIPSSLPAATTWNNAIDAAEASTVESSSDWMLPNDRMLDTITRDDTANPLNIAPFNLGVTLEFWTSTTSPQDTTQARRCVNTGGGGLFGQASKAGNNASYIFCRKFI